MSNQDRVRLHLAVTKDVKRRLDRLLKATDAESLTEVFRRALTVYDDVVTTYNDGGDVILRDSDGKRRHIKPTW